MTSPGLPKWPYLVHPNDLTQFSYTMNLPEFYLNDLTWVLPEWPHPSSAWMTLPESYLNDHAQVLPDEFN